MNKKGVSAVIATVMLIMITVIAAGLIFSFVIPFVNQQTEEASDCFGVFGGLEFGETAYNCYVEAGPCGESGDSTCYNGTGFSIEVTKEGVAGLKVALIKGGSSEIFEIEDGSSSGGLEMLTSGDNITIPSVGEMRTYIVGDIYETAKVSAVLENGKTCEAADNLIFRECLGDYAVGVGRGS
tara:strand:+ start:256 stop:801 length:546 start_codon:yes stop_codon:yes gene_type:complete